MLIRVCGRCGERFDATQVEGVTTMLARWRFNGESWEHKCEGEEQAGHLGVMVGVTIDAEGSQSRAALARAVRRGAMKPLL